MEGVGADGEAAELQASHFALEGPGVAVDVEDALAEEVAEDGGEGFALWVVVEVGFEDVVDVVGVGGEDVGEDVDGDGGGGGVGEEVGVPIG